MAGRPSLPGGAPGAGKSQGPAPKPPFRPWGTSRKEAKPFLSCARASSDRHRSVPIAHRISMISDKSDYSCYRIFVNPQPDKGSFYYFFFVFC